MTETMPFPALRRLAVTSPEVLRSLPCSLGAGLGSRYVEATADRRRAGNPRSLVALDSGGGLAGWQAIRWLDRGTGHLVEVTTDPNEPNAVLLSTLDDKAVEWSHPPRYGPVESVVVDPDFVRIVGRVSGVLDAYLEGLPGDLVARRPLYQDDGERRLASVWASANALGAERFSARTGLSLKVARRATRRLPISKTSVRRAMRAIRGGPVQVRACAVCGVPVGRPNAKTCSKLCRDRAYRARRRAKSDLS